MVSKRNSLLIFLSIFSLIFGIVSCSTSIQARRAGIWYSVRKGDTLEKISKKYSVSQRTIQRQTSIYVPKDISVGMRILIPGAKNPIARRPTYRPKQVKISRNLIWPAKGRITSGFGMRFGRVHEGIDISKDGGRDIRAAASGIVVFAGHKRGYGKTIIINHGRGIKTLYAHNSRIYVRKGVRVRQGDFISKMGSSGKSSGIHLHFEVHLYGKPRNPLRFLPVR
jgi:murein DD-endopeptidase MepM/ murein hydrolase activator NlpD